MLGVSSVISSYVNHKDETLERDVFADQACQILNLPRLVTNHKGGAIVADLDDKGTNSRVTVGHPYPRQSVDQDIQAWNITPREAKILVLMARNE